MVGEYFLIRGYGLRANFHSGKNGIKLQNPSKTFPYTSFSMKISTSQSNIQSLAVPALTVKSSGPAPFQSELTQTTTSLLSSIPQTMVPVGLSSISTASNRTSTRHMEVVNGWRMCIFSLVIPARSLVFIEEKQRQAQMMGINTVQRIISILGRRHRRGLIISSIPGFIGSKSQTRACRRSRRPPACDWVNWILMYVYV